MLFLKIFSKAGFLVRILFVTVMYNHPSIHQSIKNFPVRVLIVNCSFCFVLASVLKYTDNSADSPAPLQVPEGYEDADCKCLPACTDYEFPAQTSFSSITEAKQLHLSDYVTEARPELKEDSYVASNMAVLHIYFRLNLSSVLVCIIVHVCILFRHLHFMRHERDELYSMVDIISNIGGLLGLCMGFSMLSAVEILYFLGLKLVSRFCGPNQ